MKVTCRCGELVHDGPDRNPFKAHVLPDQALFDFLETVDRAIEGSGPRPKEKEAACMAVRRLFGELTRGALQCPGCRRLFLEDGSYALNVYEAEPDNPTSDILRSRSQT